MVFFIVNGWHLHQMISGRFIFFWHPFLIFFFIIIIFPFLYPFLNNFSPDIFFHLMLFLVTAVRLCAGLEGPGISCRLSQPSRTGASGNPCLSWAEVLDAVPVAVNIVSFKPMGIFYGKLGISVAVLIYYCNSWST